MNTSLSKTSLPTALMMSSAVLLLLTYFFLPEFAAASTGLDATAGAANLDAGPGIPILIGSLIRSALSLVGVVFLILMVYAGFLWMTAAGSDEKIGKAKKMIVSAIVGIIIIFASYTITDYVLDAVIPADEAVSQE